jgi:hypothetical protein
MILLLFKLSLTAYVITTLIQPEQALSWYGKILDNMPYWVANPLGLCFKCFTGQVCFWGYLIKYIHEYILIDHLFFTSLGIFLSLIYDWLWIHLEQ